PCSSVWITTQSAVSGSTPYTVANSHSAIMRSPSSTSTPYSAISFSKISDISTKSPGFRSMILTVSTSLTIPVFLPVSLCLKPILPYTPTRVNSHGLLQVKQIKPQPQARAKCYPPGQPKNRPYPSSAPHPTHEQ